MTTLPARPRWTTILALLLVPLLVAGGFLWGTWDANPRLRTVHAAVVNNDEMVTVNGQVMPLGRQLAAELVNSDRAQNLTWVLADEKHAQAGLADGTYAAVVTIPPEFSAAATSFSKAPADAVQATIRVQTSPVTGVSETALGQHIANSASNALNRFLTGEYLKNIYLGFNQMGDQFLELTDGTRRLADGAAQLADGTGQSAAGAGQLADGLGQASAGGPQLRSGARQLTDGTRQLADGAGQWASGSRQLTTGLTTYADGVRQYSDGVKQYVGVVNPIVARVRDLVAQVPDWGDLVAKLDPIIDSLDEWAARIDPQVQGFVTRFKAFLTQLDELVGDSQRLRATLDAYASKVTTTEIACPPDLAGTPGACEAFARGVDDAQAKAKAQLATAQQQAKQLSIDAEALHRAISRLVGAADQLAAASAKFAAAVPGLQTQWAEFKKMLPNGTLTKADVMSLLNQFVAGGNQLLTGGDALASGADQLVDGSKQLTSGADQLASGARQLADGQQRYADGIDLYTRGIDQAASGASKLAGGLRQLDDGAKQLADGTKQLADGVAEGADRIPHYTDGERENLAKVVSSPISTDGLDELVLPTIAWASLLVVMALWIGALAAYAVFRAVDPRNLLSSDGNGRLVWRSYAPALAVGGVQGLALALLGSGVLGLDAPRAAGVAAVALVAAASFVAVNHALAAWFGTKGRVASLAFLLVTVISAVAYSAPGSLSALKGLSPLTPALDAIRMVMTGHSATIPVLVLAAWGVAGLFASWIAVARSRTVPLASLT